MASTNQKFLRNTFRGVNRANGQHRLADGEVWDLLNFRVQDGRLVVTPPLKELFTLTNLTDEVSQTQIKFLSLVRNLSNALRYLIINHKTARYVDPTSTATQVQIPVVLQTKKPNRTTVNGECLLYGHNVSDFSATGDKIEVEIQTATTFRWRRNGGAWVSGVTISTEVSLGGNGLKVSFQDDEGYTTSDLWEWTRSWNHPYTGADSSTDKFPFHSAVYNKDIYVAGIERNVMRVRDDFLTSVGYTRVYGKYVCLFQNILFVAHYAAGVYDGALGIVDGYNAANTPFTVGWSHNSNPDQFFSTDVNEADEYQFPQQAAHDWSNLGITGMGEQNDQLFVYLPTSIKRGYYSGLPTVMQWKTVHPSVGNLFPAGLVNGVNGHYFISRNDVYVFNGLELRSIGQGVIRKFKSEIVPITNERHALTTGYYDPDRAEVVFTYWMSPSTGIYHARQMVYCEQTGVWYFRNLPSEDSGGTDIYTQSVLPSSWGKSIFGGSGKVYVESTDDAGTFPADDVSTGVPLFTVPLVETKSEDYGHRAAVKEADSMQLDFSAEGATITTSIEVAAINNHSDDKTWVAAKSFNIDDATTWRKLVGKARTLAYRFKLGTGVTQIKKGIFTSYEEQVYGIPIDTEK